VSYVREGGRSRSLQNVVDSIGQVDGGMVIPREVPKGSFIGVEIDVFEAISVTANISHPDIITSPKEKNRRQLGAKWRRGKVRHNAPSIG